MADYLNLYNWCTADIIGTSLCCEEKGGAVWIWMLLLKSNKASTWHIEAQEQTNFAYTIFGFKKKASRIYIALQKS